mgnify:FL=1|jgi:hypothetical protein|tara:strand:- start:548 stop:955 length:408 start_codon:yes stop_codon:yes gene_type:complete
MPHAISELDSQGLRHFALIFALIISGVFGLIVPLISGRGFLWFPWVIGGIFVAWGLLAPASVRPFYRLWMHFGLIMNAIISRVVLGIVFYLIVVPFGLVLRFRGLDPLKRKWDPTAPSYRVASDKQDPKHMERPF